MWPYVALHRFSCFRWPEVSTSKYILPRLVSLADAISQYESGKTLLLTGIVLADNQARLPHVMPMQPIREDTMKRIQRAATSWTLLASLAGLCFTTSAHADGRAAQKLGQMGIINQTFQPKPPHSSPGYSAQPDQNSNSGYGPRTINPNNGTVNGVEAARAGAAANGAAAQSK
jgi:hypothetical protein